jgi:ferredoxin
MKEIYKMAYVITEKCHGERYGLCATVCPVEAIFPGTYQGKDFMVIDPALCISCGACAAECPVGSIVESEDADPVYAKINAELVEQFRSNPKAAPRSRDEAPKKPGNSLK